MSIKTHKSFTIYEIKTIESQALCEAMVSPPLHLSCRAVRYKTKLYYGLTILYGICCSCCCKIVVNRDRDLIKTKLQNLIRVTYCFHKNIFLFAFLLIKTIFTVTNWTQSNKKNPKHCYIIPFIYFYTLLLLLGTESRS